jgi:3-oxoacyl-[acyl-carrier protein] reductase
VSTSLKGKTAIVTGASRGIGLAIARALAKEGVRLVLVSRTKPPADVRGKFIKCDLSDLQRIPAVVTQALRHLGAVDCLINNAGIFLEKPVPEISVSDWDRVMRVNLSAPFLLCRAVLPHMIARKQGRIINIASTSSMQGYLNQSAYCASKHGLLGFARSLAMEARPHHIHVYNLCPGGVDTDLIKGTYLGERLKGQLLIDPADVAQMVIFLLKQPENVDLSEVVVRRFSP